MGTKNKPGKFDCLSKAGPDEEMFVLLERDPVAASLVDLWATLRERMGGVDPEKIAEARACANRMAKRVSDADKGKLILAMQSLGIPAKLVVEFGLEPKP